MARLLLSPRVSFISMMLLTSSFFLVEIIIGYLSNSMALVADSFHMLSDVVSLIVGYLALRFTKKGTQTEKYTFGWARAEVLGALVNAVFLVALCFSILVEALKRLIMPEELHDARLVLIIGGVGLFINIIGLFLFHQHGHGHSHGSQEHGHSKSNSDLDKKNAPLIQEEITEDRSTAKLLPSSDGLTSDLPLTDVSTNDSLMAKESKAGNGGGDVSVTVKDTSSSGLNIRGVYLHVMGDALGSVIVMISALIILYTEGDWTKYVDPSLSILMVLIILKTSIPLLKESSMILMQTVPPHIKKQEIQDRLVQCVPEVLGVHEFHIWQLAGSRIIASAHVRCNTLMDYMAIANQVKEFFHNEGIHSTTIQPEFVEPISESIECLLKCQETCDESTCCGDPPTQPNKKKSRENSTETSSKSDV